MCINTYQTLYYYMLCTLYIVKCSNDTSDLYKSQNDYKTNMILDLKLEVELRVNIIWITSYIKIYNLKKLVTTV